MVDCLSGCTIPRPEHPKPQFVRESWVNLNGSWDFAFDFNKSGKEKDFAVKGEFPERITVPFCPESTLSGIGYTDFIPAVWYRRTVSLSKEQLGGRVILHFGAVDYHAEVFVNGAPAGSHDGGYVSFALDITAFVREGENTLVVYAEDDVRSGKQPTGKQCHRLASSGCEYTRTTGIWQTVGLEFVPKTYMTSVKLIPNANDASAALQVKLNRMAAGETVSVTVAFDGKEVGSASSAVNGDFAAFTVKLSERHLWEVGAPALYDITYTLSGAEPDVVKSYFGLRSVSLSDQAICINEKPVFQRLVLDQGFYPDGIYTAPTDEALKNDILLSQAVGFNGARLHEKVFEERFLYWADKLGYLVWGEFPNWGLDHSKDSSIQHFLPEWTAEVERDFNHPAIVGWCPFNETWDVDGRRQSDYLLRQVYQVTKALDQTRPVIDTSGNFHVATDVYDVHDYEQDPAVFAAHYEPMKSGGAVYDSFSDRQHYAGQPYFVSEYGGTWWKAELLNDTLGKDNADRSTSWGYGEQCVTEEQVGKRISALTKVLLEHPGICAFCYTQLTDVEQEQNGVYDYHRQPKFSPAVYQIIKEGFSSPAAIEQE